MDTFRRSLPMVALVVAAAALLGWGRIPQPAGYHAFADTRAWAGVANACDVLSNAAFAMVGLGAIFRLLRTHRDSRLDRRRAALWLFALALLATAFGSAWYHLAPDNARLVWDRIPIALACAGLLAAAYARTHPPAESAGLALALAVLAVASVLWWSFTESRGAGDLRLYLLLQGAPLVMVPLWQWIAGSPARERLAFGAAVLLYVLAKAAELEDRAVFEFTGAVSGHSVKHLFAAVAAVFAWRTVAATE